MRNIKRYAAATALTTGLGLAGLGAASVAEALPGPIGPTPTNQWCPGQYWNPGWGNNWDWGNCHDWRPNGGPGPGPIGPNGMPNGGPGPGPWVHNGHGGPGGGPGGFNGGGGHGGGGHGGH